MAVSPPRLLEAWKLEREVAKLDDQRTEHTLTWTDPETGLEVRCVAIEYHDFPTVEWTLYFKNTGSDGYADPADVQAIDTSLRAAAGRGPRPIRLARANSSCTITSGARARRTTTSRLGRALPRRRDEADRHLRRPADEQRLAVFQRRLAGRRRHRRVSAGRASGRPTSRRDAADGLRVRAGQELTHFKLHARRGSPHAAGGRSSSGRATGSRVAERLAPLDAGPQLPRPGGKPLPPVLLAAAARTSSGEMIDANEENQMLFIDRYLEERLTIDYWWMDAGWYPCDGQLAQDRHLGGGPEAIPRRPAGDQRPRAGQGHQDHRLVRAGAGRAGHLAGREPSRVDPGRHERRPAEPGQSRGPRSG